jgi:hypothetical protein
MAGYEKRDRQKVLRVVWVSEMGRWIHGFTIQPRAVERESTSFKRGEEFTLDGPKE